MTILPKINYHPPAIWFNSLDSTITKFYWKNKKLRIKLTTLQKPKNLGGLNAPNFFNYFLANQLQIIIKWIHPTKQCHPWIDIEQQQCKELDISTLPFISTTIKRHNCFKNPSIATALTAWWKAHNIMHLKHTPCKFTPLWNNPDFLQDKKPLNFITWKDKGITQLQHSYHSL